MSQFIITLDIHSYWHIGSGEEGGSYADALVLKNAAGLPYVPGKSLKGLYRDGFEKAVAADWFASKLLDLLFGSEGTAGIQQQGVIQFSSATLSPAETNYFTSESGKSAKKSLFRVIQSTKIGDKGVAEEGSFRAVEVAVPMQLNACVSLNTSHPNYQQVLTLFGDNVTQALDRVSRLIFSLGAKRQRGYGEVNINVTSTEEVA